MSGDSLDAVIARLPAGSDWRRFTPVSMSLFAASPYNAAAQTRYDGYGDTPAAQLRDALAKMAAARAKASAGRNPKGQDRADGLGRNDEHATAAPSGGDAQTPPPSERGSGD
jgi:hypothetical protein